MTREPLKPGQKVWVKKHIDRPLAGTVMFGRPEQPGVAEEDRLYKIQIDDTCACRNADLEPDEIVRYSPEWNAAWNSFVEAGKRMSTSDDRAAWEQFAESGRKLGIILPLRKDGK